MIWSDVSLFCDKCLSLESSLFVVLCHVLVEVSVRSEATATVFARQITVHKFSTTLLKCNLQP